MALFGVQLVVTMVMASVLQKLSSHFSIARWMLCNRLVRYLHPSDEELKMLAGIQHVSNKGKGKKGKDRQSEGSEKDSEFLVPKKLDLQLDSVVIKPIDMLQLRYYSEYQWLVDFALCAIIVYIITEFYYFFLPPKEEVNLSILWCILVVGFTMKILLTLTALYFKGDEAIGERSLCISAGGFFFLLAMIVLIADENILEFGLEPAYSSFNSSAFHFLQNQGLNSSGPASQLMFKLSLAVWSGLMGTFFTFPGLRFARMHHDCLKYCDDKPFTKLFLHLSFLSPLLILVMWVKPLARDYFTQRTWPGMNGVLMRPDVFETVRLMMLIGIVILRFILMPHYLQSYLNLAPGKIEQLRKEAGRISNIELQRLVARVFYYLCVVALQYIAPLLLCLFTTLMLKTLGEYTWSSYLWSPVSNQNKTLPMLPIIVNDDTIISTSQHFSLTLNNLKRVFTPVLYRGVLGFMTWWLCAVWFGTSAIGVIYHYYF